MIVSVRFDTWGKSLTWGPAPVRPGCRGKAVIAAFSRVTVRRGTTVHHRRALSPGSDAEAGEGVLVDQTVVNSIEESLGQRLLRWILS
jgi:hypothetical protein